MRCPRCKDYRLKEHRIEALDLLVDQCPDCKGVWLDKKQLENSFDAAAKELTVYEDAKELHTLCPTCESKPLFAMKYPQTLAQIEMCRSCAGFWLDPNEWREIKTVREHLATQGLLEPYAPLTGIKGKLIRFIEDALDKLVHDI